MQEIWKDVVGYEGLYQVSNMGAVKSLISHKILRQSPTNCGYYKVQLYRDGYGKMHYTHRLVATAFIPNPLGKCQVNHIDGIKANNNVMNLEWASPSDNQKHAINHGLRERSPMTGRHGRDNPLSVPILQYDKNGNLIAQWDSIGQAATHLHCNRSVISNCLNGRYKTASGFVWRFK